jgi:D-alanine-D-alanine ligase
VAKRLVASAGVRVPLGITLAPSEAGADAEDRLNDLADRLPFPWLLKPAFEGSSKGIRARCLVDSVAEARDVHLSLANDYDQPVLVEEFISGEEVTVGLVGNDPEYSFLEAMRVVPTRANGRFVYSIELKRDWSENVRYETPARLDWDVRARLFASASDAFRALGCRDVARIDFRVRDGVPYFIEANPLPGLAPDWSDLVILAGGAGVGYVGLIRLILAAALSRAGLAEPAARGSGR